MGDDGPVNDVYHETPGTLKKSKLSKDTQKLVGIILLIVVNIVWVGSAELTRYLFVDLHFKRPFFTTYVKSCLFTIFMLKSCINLKDDGQAENNNNQSEISKESLEEAPEIIEEDSSEESLFEIESLTPAEFEPVHLSSDSDTERPVSPVISISLFDENDDNLSDGFGPFTEKDKFITKEPKPSFGQRIREKSKRVKFAMFREVRRLPASIALEARLARLSYRQREGLCDGCFETSTFLGYMFLFAPLWFISSTTYQAALCFDNVSFVTMISSSSSLFVLAFGAINPKRSQDKFTWTKLIFVVLNLIGVALVSQLTGTGYGLLFSLISAISYAAFLQTFSSMTGSKRKVDRFLMFGTIGTFSVFACTPLILIAHVTKIEPQLPWPTREEFFLVVLNGVVGSIFADYLWIWATELTSSLISSLSLTLSIPLSFLADSLFRNQSPTFAQVVASIPIMASFIGAALIQNQKVSKTKVSSTMKKNFKKGDGEMANLISDDAEEQL